MSYLDEGINVLKMIEKRGFEAFFVGGAVRDILSGNKNISDIDITTSALPRDIIKIFDKTIDIGKKYGTIIVISNGYKFEITTYRKELKYDNNRKPTVEFIKDKIEDIKRRDLTINAILMDYCLKVVDPLEFLNDFVNKKIRVIGDISNKLEEDPLRLLRIIRFIGKYEDFEIDNKILDFFEQNDMTIIYKNISTERVREELIKIFGLNMTNRNKCFYYLSKYLNNIDLYRNIDKLIDKSFTNLGFISFLYKDLPQNELKLSKKDYRITKIVNKFVNKDLTLTNLFEIDSISLVIIQEINSFLYNINKDYIKEKEKLPIKTLKDLDISSLEIIEIIGIENKKELGNIYEQLVTNVLNGFINNNKCKIREYIYELKGNNLFNR